jgi:predicted nucleic acid-binding protein
VIRRRLDLLEGIKGLCTTEEVWGELEVAKRRRVLEIAREELRVEVLKMGEDEEESFLRLSSRFGRGEASCLAIALHRDAGILTDDLDARRFAQRGNIPVSGSIGVLVKCVVNGNLSLEEVTSWIGEHVVEDADATQIIREMRDKQYDY